MPAQALPADGTVTSGGASLNTTSNRLDITQSTDKVIIEYSDFSIGAAETVQFFQPGPNAAALNRVVNAEPLLSQIDGQLLANGRVFLINPAGIVFSSTAQVSVHGLIASALGISDTDFLAGNYAFSGGPSASVENWGDISTDAGGHVLLIGPSVQNYGTINAPQGSIALAGGSSAYISTEPDNAILLEVPTPDGLADNFGTLQSDGGRVRMWAGAVNQDGLVSAKNMVGQPWGSDRVELIGQDSVLLSATSTTEAGGASGAADGGLVAVESPDGGVTVDSGGVIDVSGGPAGGNAGGASLDAPLGTVDMGGVIDATAQAGSLSKPVHLSADYVLLGGAINTQGGPVELVAGGDMVINGSVSAQENSVNLSALGTIDVSGSVTIQTGDICVYTEGSVVTHPGSTVAVSGQGNVAVLASGGTYLDGPAGEGQLNGQGGVVDLAGSLSTQNGDISIGGDAGVVLQPTAEVSAEAGNLVEIRAGSALSDAEGTSSEGALPVPPMGGVTVAGSVSAASGDVIVAADWIQMQLTGSMTNSGPGDVLLSALTGDAVVTGVAADAHVTVTAAGAILDGGDSAPDVAGPEIELLAADGIGAPADAIETDGGKLAAATQNGGVYLTDVGDGLEVGTVGGTSGVSALGGSPGKNIVVTVNSSLVVSSAVSNASAGGAIELEAGEVIVQDGGTVVNAGGGDVTIRSTAGDATVTGVSGSAVVSVQSAAGILDGGDAATDIVAPDVELVATTGIGSASDRVDVDADRLAATTGTGGVHIQDVAGGLELADVGSTSGVSIQTGAAGDGIDVVALGPLTVSSDVTATGGASIRLSAEGTGPADDLLVDARVFAGGGGAVALLAGDQVIVGGGDVDTDWGDMLLSAAGDVWLQAGSTVGATTAGGVELTADSDADLAGAVRGDPGSAIGNPSAAGAMVLAGADIVLDGTLSGIGSLTIQPSSPATSIGIAGGAGDFPLDESDIAALASGFSSLTIGRADGAHAIAVGPVTFYVPVTIRAPAPGGSIAVNGGIVGADGASISICGSGAATTLNADITTEGSAILIDDGVVLGAPALVTLDATGGGAAPSGADVTITGPVDDAVAGSSALLVNAGTGGAVDLQGAVGATTAPAGLDLTGNVIGLQAVMTTGAQTYAGAGAAPAAVINADLTAGGPLTIRDALTVDLAGGADLSAAGAISISDGVIALNLAGPDGAANVIDADGDESVTLPAVTAAHSPDLTVNSEGGITINAVDIGTGTLTVNVDNDGDGAETMRVGAVAAGAVNVAGSGEDDVLRFDGGIVAADVVVSHAALVDLNADVTADAGVAVQNVLAVNVAAGVSAGDGVAFGGPVTFDGPGDQEVDAGAGTLDAQGALTKATAGNLTLTAHDVQLAGTVADPGGVLTLQPSDPATSIGIAGGAGDFSLDATEVALLSDGFSAIVIGRADGLHVIVVDDVQFTDPVTIRTPAGGSITLDGTLTGADDASVTLIGALASTTVNADIVTDANAILIEDALVLGAPALVTLDTTNGGAFPAGADVTITGSVADDDAVGSPTALAINAGSGGTVSLQDVSTGDGQTYDGLLALHGDLVALGGSILLNGPVTLGADVAITTSGTPGDITFAGVVDGAQALTLDSALGVLVLPGPVGSVTPLGALSASAGSIDVSAVTVTGDVALVSTLGDVTLTGITGGGVVSVTSAGAVLDGGEDVTDIVASDAELVAATGIGTSEDMLDVDVTRMAATTQSGGIHIEDVAGDLEIATVGSTTGVSVLGGVEGDDISIVVSSLLTVSAPVSDLAAGGDVWLSAGGLLSIGAAVSTDSGAIGMEAGELSVLDGGSVANGGVGSISLKTTAGDAVIARISGGGLATVQSAAAIRDGAETETDVVAPDIEFIAASGIAEKADYMEIDGERMAATTQSGGIYIEDVAGGLEVTSVGSTSGVSILGATAGDIYLAAFSPLTITEDVQNLSGGGIVLAALGTTAGDDLSIGGNVVAVGGAGSIQLFAGSDILHTGGMSTQGGNILMTAGDMISLSGTVGTGVGSVFAQAGQGVDVGGSIGTQGGSVLLRGDGAVTVSGSVLTQGGSITIITSALDATGGTIDTGGGSLIISFLFPTAFTVGSRADFIADLEALFGGQAVMGQEEEEERKKEEQEGAAEAEAAALLQAHPAGESRPAL